MFGGIISSVKGSYTIMCEGRFPERILNTASTAGIYVHSVRRVSPSAITFCVSKKGCDALLATDIEGLSLTVTDSYGLPVFFRKYKKRVILYSLPVIFLATSFFLSLFIWRIEFIGGDENLQKEVAEVLARNGVYKGALKHKIDRYEIKRKAILNVSDLSWVWVDVKGTSAYVKIAPRKAKPNMNEIHESADVISLYSGVIEKLQVYCGTPLLCEGMTVEKGQVVVTGVFKSEKENIPTYYHHACADVTVRLTEKKTVIIPKEIIKKTPTGEKKSVYSINFKKNNVKFSLNSGISYPEYDKIEKTVKVPFLPISFSRTIYQNVTVTKEAADTSSLIDERRRHFTDGLLKKDMQIQNTTEEVTDNGDHLSVTFCADCLVRADKEIPIKGDSDGENR